MHVVGQDICCTLITAGAERGGFTDDLPGRSDF